MFSCQLAGRQNSAVAPLALAAFENGASVGAVRAGHDFAFSGRQFRFRRIPAIYDQAA